MKAPNVSCNFTLCLQWLPMVFSSNIHHDFLLLFLLFMWGSTFRSYHPQTLDAPCITQSGSVCAPWEKISSDMHFCVHCRVCIGMQCTTSKMHPIPFRFQLIWSDTPPPLPYSIYRWHWGDEHFRAGGWQGERALAKPHRLAPAPTGGLLLHVPLPIPGRAQRRQHLARQGVGIITHVCFLKTSCVAAPRKHPFLHTGPFSCALRCFLIVLYFCLDFQLRRKISSYFSVCLLKWFLHTKFCESTFQKVTEH